MQPFNVLRDSWYFFSHNLQRIAQLCLPLLLLEALLRQQLHDWLGEQLQAGHDVLLSLLFYPLYSAALILFADDLSQGRQRSNRELFAEALRLWPRFAVLSGLSSLLIMFGFSLLVLPGLWIMFRLVFAEYLLVLRGASPLAALVGSFSMSQGQFWRIAACLLGVMLPLWLFDWWSYQQLGEQPDALISMLLDAANGFLQLLPILVGLRLFMLRSTPPVQDDSAL